MRILGISCFYHDSAAAMIVDGEITAAVQEERFTRIKHDSNFPSNAIDFCLNENEVSLSQIDYVVFYEKPFLKFERIIETYIEFAPKGFLSFKNSIPLWVKEKLFQKKNIISQLKLIDKLFDEKKLLFSEHHLSHASSAFFPSPFNEAAILVMDGVGEWSTTSLGIGDQNKVKILKEINFPNSLGLLYSSFTYYCGFKVNSGEYKLMGLAPYGDPKFEDIIQKELIDIKSDGSFKLNMKYFDYCTNLKMTNKLFDKLFDNSLREPGGELKQVHMDLAASIQKVVERIIIKIVKKLKDETQLDNLCLAGGVALNCVVNGLINKHKIFNNIWIQPASGDAGGALGAALLVYYHALDRPREISKSTLPDLMKGGFLGPSFSNKDVENALKNIGARFQKYDFEEVLNITVKKISEGNAIGWMQGKMEFGPRSLGSRSILADPRIKDMQKKLNLKIKYRESFRPFAPSIVEEDLKDWFDLDIASPYMLLVDKVNSQKLFSSNNKKYGIDKLNEIRSAVPAITHVDNSARIQTVNRKTNSRYYDLISKFKELTSCSLLINTSFNVRGEPIVCNVEDAFKCFMGTELDVLVIEDYILYKSDQSNELFNDYKNKFLLD